jgi:hypothetical protein
MSMPDVLTALAVLSSTVALCNSVWQLHRHRSTEQEAVRRLAESYRFRDAVAEFMEAMDRDGAPPEGKWLEDISARIVPEIMDLPRGAADVMEALFQASPEGRARYVQKLLIEVVEELEREGHALAPLGPERLEETPHAEQHPNRPSRMEI